MDIRIVLNRWIAEMPREDETKAAYKRAAEKFMVANKMSANFDTEKITHEHYASFLVWLRKHHKRSTNTQALYSVGVSRFLDYLVYNDLSTINLEKVRIAKSNLAKQNRPSMKTISMADVDEILESADMVIEHSFDNERAKLRAYRDRAFLLTLADTGLRVFEACELKRGDINWDEGRAIIIGKGKKQGVIRFSDRSLAAIKDYLSVRAEADGSSGKPLASLPVFARHDKGASTRIEPIETMTGRNIIKDWVMRVFGEAKPITPHSFRHYFVTTVLRATGNIKRAKVLARHSDISITDRYAQVDDDEADQTYYEIFNKRKNDTSKI